MRSSIGAGVVAVFALAFLLPFATAANAALAESIRHDFKGGTDGANPAGGVIEDSSGALYGVTTNGGGSGCSGGGCGIAYEISASKTYTVLHHFQGGAGDGAKPAGSLLLDPASGALYGVTAEGGSGVCGSDGLGCGTVFKLTPPPEGQTRWIETIIHDFTGCCSGDGGAPQTTLIADESGALYGTTAGYGPNGGGTVFKLTPPAAGKKKWVLTTLYGFCAQPHCADGTNSYGALLFIGGNLYGTTANGGAMIGGNNGSGTVFELAPPAEGKGAWTETVLDSFEGYNATPADQANPYGRIVPDAEGNLYGCTTAGAGGVFKLSPPEGGIGNWSKTVLHTFNNYSEGYGCLDLTMDSTGALYGANPSSLADENGGTLFKLAPPANAKNPWHFSVIHTFGPNAHNPNWFPGGTHPSQSLLFDNGALYGAASGGGALANQAGVAFVFSPNP